MPFNAFFFFKEVSMLLTLPVMVGKNNLSESSFKVEDQATCTVGESGGSSQRPLWAGIIST